MHVDVLLRKQSLKQQFRTLKYHWEIIQSFLEISEVKASLGVSSKPLQPVRAALGWNLDKILNCQAAKQRKLFVPLSRWAQFDSRAGVSAHQLLCPFQPWSKTFTPSPSPTGWQSSPPVAARGGKRTSGKGKEGKERVGRRTFPSAHSSPTACLTYPSGVCTVGKKTCHCSKTVFSNSVHPCIVINQFPSHWKIQRQENNFDC